MLQDKSADFKDTWKFLDCRMDEIKLVGHAVSDVCTYYVNVFITLKLKFTTQVVNCTG